MEIESDQRVAYYIGANFKFQLKAPISRLGTYTHTHTHRCCAKFSWRVAQLIWNRWINICTQMIRSVDISCALKVKIVAFDWFTHFIRVGICFFVFRGVIRCTILQQFIFSVLRRCFLNARNLCFCQIILSALKMIHSNWKSIRSACAQIYCNKYILIEWKCFQQFFIEYVLVNFHWLSDVWTSDPTNTRSNDFFGHFKCERIRLRNAIHTHQQASCHIMNDWSRNRSSDTKKINKYKN